MKNPSVQKLRAFLFRSNDDESGAIALLCLAAVLALMMMAWVILDAHKSSKDKIMLQGAADTAAFSHAAVEARSMNMIAYANIAKRSIIGVHSLYPAMYFAYTTWLLSHMARCFKWLPNLSSCVKFFNNVFTPWGAETIGDHIDYSGNPFTPYLNAGIEGIKTIANWLGLGLGSGSSAIYGNSKKAYAKDIKALDNYQKYMVHITPWWGWSEQLSRGWRNGATAVASFPPPPGQITVVASAVQQTINTINSVLGAFGMGQIDLTTFHGYDNLPLKRKNFDVVDWDTNYLTDPIAIAEHALNVVDYTRNSSKGAKSWSVILGGSTVSFATIGILYSKAAFGDTVDPYVLDDGGSEGEWLKRTSNMTFAYLNDTDRMDEDRNKFSVPSKEYSHSGLSVAGLNPQDMIYKTGGYWTMAKSEITYNTEGSSGWLGGGSKPDMWHPSWTARMRPVHLPGEFAAGNFSMFDAYMQMVPYLALSAQIGSVNGSLSETGDAVLESMKDMAVLGMRSAAMGPSTAGGIAK